MTKLKRKSKAEDKPLYKKASAEYKEREEKELTKKPDSMLDVVEEELAELGVTPFSNVNVEDEYLQLPADITEEPSRELGKYFNAFTQQKMWTRTIVGRLSTTVREMRRSLDEVKADVFSSHPAKMSIKEKELLFQIDSRSREMLDDMFIYEEKLKMAGDYLANIEDAIILISREISRRTSDWNTEQRADNIGKKRR